MAKANPWSRCCEVNSLFNEGIFMISLPQLIVLSFPQNSAKFVYPGSMVINL